MIDEPAEINNIEQEENHEEFNPLAPTASQINTFAVTGDTIVEYFDCGLKSEVRKVHSNGLNFGKLYLSCPKPSFEDRCSYFQFCGPRLEELAMSTSSKNKVDEDKGQMGQVYQ